MSVIQPTGYSQGVSGQQAVTASAAQLNGASTLVGASYLLLKSIKANTTTIYVGFSNAVTTSTGYALDPGDIVQVPISMVNSLWIVGTVGATLTWLALR